MKRTRLFIIVLLIFCIVALLSCRRKADSTEQLAAAKQHDTTAVNGDIEIENISAQESVFPGADPLSEERSYFQEGRLENIDSFGIVYNTIVNTDLANIHASPSLESDVLFQALFDTKITVIGTSRDGHWLLVTVIENYELIRGWISSNYVLGENITPSEIRITGLSERASGARVLTGTYMHGNSEIEFYVYSHKQPDQPFWTFVWNVDEKDFRYNNIPGTYAWYPETNELKHITYISPYTESAWSIFTDDFKYILHDIGTGPGVRGLEILQVDNEELVFSGSYLRSINLNGYTVQIVYPVYLWDRNRRPDEIDEEIMAFAEEFRKNNPEPPDMVQQRNSRGIELIIVCEFNFDTKTRRILGGEYIFVY